MGHCWGRGFRKSRLSKFICRGSCQWYRRLEICGVYFYEYDKAFNWSDGGVEVTRNRHQIATGIGYTTDITSFDIAYTFSTWGITTNGYLEEIYYAHRLLASFALRF